MRIALSNAALASIAALLAWVAGRLVRKPALTHALWVIVLLKLITPPLWSVPVQWPAERSKGAVKAAPAVRPFELARPRSGDSVVSAPDLDEFSRAANVDRQTAKGEATPRGIVQSHLRSDLRVAESEVSPGESREVPSDVIASDAPVLTIRAPESTASATPIRWAHWAWIIGATIWAIGAMLNVGVSVARISRFRRVLRFALPAETSCQRRADQLSRRLGLSAAPRIEIVPGAVCPMLWSAGFSPRVLVPSGLWERLDSAQRDTLLLHELAHLRRRDHWVRWLELLVTALYWWLPIVWWARHQMREAEEQCCDAWVLWAMPDSFRQYASALLEAVDFVSVRRSVPLLASGMGQFGHLRRRLTMLKQGDVARAMSWTGFFAACGTGALLLSIAPTWAQSVTTETKPETTSTTPIVTQSTDQAQPGETAPAAAPAEKSDVKPAAPEAPASAAPAAPTPVPPAAPEPGALPVAVTVAPLFTTPEDVAPASPSPQPRVRTDFQFNNNKDTEFREELSVVKSDVDGQYVVIGKNNKDANDELAQARRDVQDLSRKLQQAAQRLKQLELAQATAKNPNQFDVQTRDGRIVSVRPKGANGSASVDAPPKGVPNNNDGDKAQTRKDAAQARMNADRERRLANVERQLSQLLDEVKRLHNDNPDEPNATPSNRAPRGRQGS
ncbi:MAG TPA: M56 family metallopeptidase [Humisphaera sp.]|nr:M56 family metallopeptidase [Humisphaera sp.]